MPLLPPRGEISGVRLSTLSSKKIRESARSVVTHDGRYGREGIPESGGSIDARMGVSDSSINCATCGLRKQLCPGHVGLLELPVQVFNMTMINLIKQWLQVLCLDCGKCMVQLGNGETMALKAAADKARSTTVCPNCGAVHPVIDLDKNGPTGMIYAFPSGSKRPTAGGSRPSFTILPTHVYEIFNRVPDELLDQLRVIRENHPRNFILDCILVPANFIRPTAKSGSSTQMSPNEYTVMIESIHRATEKLRQTPIPEEANRRVPHGDRIDNTPDTISPIFMAAYRNLVLLIHEFTIGTPNDRGSKTQITMVGQTAQKNPALLASVPKKSGIIRGLILGRIVEGIARSTISGNPQLTVDSVGIPQAFAMVMGPIEVVQAQNIDFLRALVKNGPNHWPGANWVRRCDTSDRMQITDAFSYELKIGDVVQRHLLNGDLVGFNRQPTLGPSSYGIHTAVIVPTGDQTFQIGTAATPLYGADFDGDAMSANPQKSQAMAAEGRVISSVASHALSIPGGGSPAIGLVQDSLAGILCLTKPGTEMSKAHAMRCMTFTGGGVRTIRVPYIHSPHNQIISGQGLISAQLCCLPISGTWKPSSRVSALEDVLDFSHYKDTAIDNGVVKSGCIVDKACTGVGANGGIFHKVALTHGIEAMVDALRLVENVAVMYLTFFGMTVGVADMFMTREMQAEVDIIVARLTQEIELIFNKVRDGSLIPPIGVSVRNYMLSLLKQKMKIPENTPGIYGPIIQSMSQCFGGDPMLNSLLHMVLSGSKGKLNNILHIAGAQGGITVAGQIPGEDSGYMRVVSHGLGRTYCQTPRFDLSLINFGFSPENYIRGLSVMSFFTGAIGGRNDLATKAMTTSITGSMNRTAVQALQSAITAYHGELIIGPEKWQRIVQVVYADAGLDPRRTRRINIGAAFRGRTDLSKTHFHPGAEVLFDIFTRDAKDFLEGYAKVLNGKIRFSAHSVVHKSAIDLHEWSVRVFRGDKIAQRTPAETAEVVNIIIDTLKWMPFVFSNPDYARRVYAAGNAAILPWYYASIVPRIHVLDTVLMNFARMTPEAANLLFATVKMQYIEAIIAPGTAVGILAAQSISEPLTQRMLDSHHSSINQGGESSDPIARPKEVMGLKPMSAEQDPHMLIKLRAEFSGETAASAFAGKLPQVSFGDLVTSKTVLYETCDRVSADDHIADQKWIDEFFRYRTTRNIPEHLLPVIIRFTLDRAKLYLKGLTMEGIAEKLTQSVPSIFIVFTSDKHDEAILRVAMQGKIFAKSEKLDVFDPRNKKLCTFTNTLLSVPVLGVPNIRFAEARKMNHFSVSDDGKFISTNRHMVYTTGININAVLKFPEVEPGQVVISSILGNAEYLGIEAARQCIVDELSGLAAIGEGTDGSHKKVYADMMCITGKAQSLERKGIEEREPDNPWLAASAKGAVPTIVSAAQRGIKSSNYGFAAPLTNGGMPHMGTYYPKITVDAKFVKENTVSVMSVLME